MYLYFFDLNYGKYISFYFKLEQLTVNKVKNRPIFNTKQHNKELFESKIKTKCDFLTEKLNLKSKYLYLCKNDLHFD